MATAVQVVGGVNMEPRERIVTFLEERPGATIREVAQALGCTPQTASHHLDVLARRDVVVKRRDGRSCHHFLARYARDPGAVLRPLMRHPRRANVVKAFFQIGRDAVTINQLTRLSGEPFGLCKRVAQRLVENGMATLERCESGHYDLRPTPTLLGAKARDDLLAPAWRGEPQNRPVLSHSR